MTAATNFVQTEVPAPAYKVVADQIIAITRAMREDAHDQETVRTALHAFAEASRATPGGTPASLGDCEVRRRY
ncbi:MAG TPA: hypothetical protein PKV98_07925 [Burkholderiaceae bacterium]|nr:hypothetical protein [Burkholderiaceae bacterium]